MQPVKRLSAYPSPLRANRKQLQSLYARRSAIDAVIASLQTYERYSVKPIELRKRKLA
jgi:hypothetical protein